jgi:hypothetical protein
MPVAGGSFSVSSPGLRQLQVVPWQRAPRSSGGGAGAAGAVEVVVREEEASAVAAEAALAEVGGGGVEAQLMKHSA